MPSGKKGDGPVSTALAWRLGMLGLRVSGDIGPWTVYVDRYGRTKWFLYSPPTKPPTPAQITQRSRFKNAVEAWKSLSDKEKTALEEAARIASIPMTGQNLYTSAALTARQESVRTIARQTGVDLPIPPEL